ncbi:MAG: polyphosphate kinase 1 [Synechococcales cyanobacterium C42_A2020_086]|nr:polyphosphate kinase 1 [Synechococcales cyanobacterium C42_A2020_086]
MPRKKAAANPSLRIVHPAPTPLDLTDPQYYLNRELSWIEFNRRVLHQATDSRTPLLERLRAMTVFSSNLDEFFMVRVATLKRRVGTDVRSLDGQTPEAQLAAIAERLRPLVKQQHQHFERSLRRRLAAQGVVLLNYNATSAKQRQYLEQYFIEQLFPVLTPLAVDPSHPFPYISNLSVNLAVVVRDRETGKEHFARVKVPSLLPRLITLPEALHTRRRGRGVVWMGVLLEQVIAHNLAALFPGMEILDWSCFRVTRNADLEFEEEDADDLMQAVEQELRRRRVGAVAIRLEIAATAPAAIRNLLLQELHLTETDVYDIEGMLNLRDLEMLVTLPLPQLKYPPWRPVIPAALRRVHQQAAEQERSDQPLPYREDIFSVLRQRDLLVHHPYDSFRATVEFFIQQAATDPAVLAIKMTLYRTSVDSPVLQSLITAAEQGKQVAVLMELKARFDEANNIQWARRLERAGIHVVYGLVGLKTHAKVALVVRQEGEEIRRYVHIGTGDYNPDTARYYTDVGLLSSREELGADLSQFFNVLTGYARKTQYRRLIVSPLNLRERLIALIRRESEHSRNGHHARIVAKMGALVDPQLIKTLYEASQSGVQIDLIVQSTCCLRPGVRQVSHNIRVLSLVGRYLEHSRIVYFHNAGQPETYISSADWMPRNLDRRIEILAPVEDPALSLDLQEILGTILADNRYIWELKQNGRYVQRHPAVPESEIDAQAIFATMAAHSEGAC